MTVEVARVALASGPRDGRAAARRCSDSSGLPQSGPGIRRPSTGVAAGELAGMPRASANGAESAGRVLQEVVEAGDQHLAGGSGPDSGRGSSTPSWLRKGGDGAEDLAGAHQAPEGEVGQEGAAREILRPQGQERTAHCERIVAQVEVLGESRADAGRWGHGAAAAAFGVGHSLRAVKSAMRAIGTMLSSPTTTIESTSV